MGKRAKVTGSSERSLLVDNRDDILVEHIQKSLDSNQLSTRMAIRKALGLQQQHYLDNFGTDLLAGAAGM